MGFQKQKLIALHLAFQCHVALSYTHAEWKALRRHGDRRERAGARGSRWLGSPGSGSEMPPLAPQGTKLCLLQEPAPGEGGARRHSSLWERVPVWEKEHCSGNRRLRVGTPSSAPTALWLG